MRTISVPAGAHELKVTLAWDDVPFQGAQLYQLTSDLDLYLLSPSQQQPRLPWTLNTKEGKEGEPAKTGEDHVNVVEQVQVTTPEPGEWQAVVRASRLSNPKFLQTYSLVFTVH